MPSVVCQRLFMKSAWGWPDPSLEWNVSTVVSSCLAVYVDLVIQLEDYNANGNISIQIKFMLNVLGRWLNSPNPIFDVVYVYFDGIF